MQNNFTGSDLNKLILLELGLLLSAIQENVTRFLGTINLILCLAEKVRLLKGIEYDLTALNINYNRYELVYCVTD